MGSQLERAVQRAAGRDTIPAISLPRVGKSDRAHALEKGMDTDLESNQLTKSIVRATILAFAGME